MKPAFAELPRPLLVSSIRQPTLAAALADIRQSEAAGAGAFILNINHLEADQRTAAVFRAVDEATACPVMAVFYQSYNTLSSEERVTIQTTALQTGMRAVDFPMDSFDTHARASLRGCGAVFAAAHPDEVSMDPEVVERQKAQIRRWQSMGAEVLMSAHVRVDLSEDQALALALEIQSRGADIVKIVTSCQSKEQALTILQTNMRLAKDLERPFIYTCQGPYGRLIRPCAPLFGTMLVFGHGAYHPLANPEKPLLANLQDFYANYAI